MGRVRDRRLFRERQPRRNAKTLSNIPNGTKTPYRKAEVDQTMDIRLHNTLTREKQVFSPQNPARVTMYVCGPTVYSYAHIGNARPAVVFDVLFRLLKMRFPGVIYARNITDIDDKINAAAEKDGVPIGTVTAKFAAIYREDMQALGVLTPTLEPHATAHVPQIIDMIERLIAKRHA